MNEDSRAHRGMSNRDWWPNQLKLGILHQHSSKSNPMGEDFNYAEEFQILDLAAVWCGTPQTRVSHSRRR